MNFSPFGSPFPSTIPLHQFAASNALVSSASTAQDTANRYHSSNVNMPHFNQPHAPILGKFRPDDTMNKYNGHSSGSGGGGGGLSGVGSNQYSVPYTQQTPDEKQRSLAASYPQSSSTTSSGQGTGTVGSSGTSQTPEISQDLCNAILQQQNDAKRVLQNVNSGWQSLTPSSAVADYLSHLPASTLPLSLHHFLKYSAENIKKEAQNPLSTIDMSQTQNTQGLNLNSMGIGNASILNQPQPPLQQHQQQHQQQLQQQQNQQQQQQQHQNGTNGSATATTTASGKKKKKKKAPKERKPRPKPGEIRLTTALDGSTLFCCPECQMAYPERGLLEQHLVGHNLERRFICDICNAALKRKDHLTRHKQSHNPERPFVCTICLKAFKRKEQLTLHFVIHSGEKRHICNECGKGFYRKDHLRKHTRSHIARRVKAELSQQNPPLAQNMSPQHSQQQQQQQQQPQVGQHQVQQQQVQQQQQQHVVQQQHQQLQQLQQHHNPHLHNQQQHQTPPPNQHNPHQNSMMS